MIHSLSLTLHPWELTVADYATAQPLPVGSAFACAITTPREHTLVCETRALPMGATSTEGPWHAFEVNGTLDFALTGVLAQLTATLAAAGISVFVLSTFKTDVILVKTTHSTMASNALRTAGHAVLVA
jgi:uncharacterized protein